MKTPERISIVEDSCSQERWMVPEKTGEPAYRLRREGDVVEGTFALLLKGVEHTEEDENKDNLPRKKESRTTLPVLADGQAVEFCYRTQQGHLQCILRGHASAESDAEAFQMMRTLWENLDVSLGSGQTKYHFSPTKDQSIIVHQESGWRAVIQPAGLRILVDECRQIGYVADGSGMSHTILYPYPQKDLFPHLNVVANAIATYPASLDISITFQPLSLDNGQQKQLHNARRIMRKPGKVQYAADSGAEVQDQKLLEALYDEIERWCQAPNGYQVQCMIHSEKPVPETLVELIGKEVFHGQPVACRVLGESGSPMLKDDQTLDLRSVIHARGGLPPLFPRTQTLKDKGVAAVNSYIPHTLSSDGIRLGYVNNRRYTKDVCFSAEDRARHCYILGSTGTGKSTLIYNMAMQDINAGVGLCLIDPHGDLYHQVLEALPESRAEDVILIDPCDSDRSVGVNYLEREETTHQAQINFAVNEMIRIFDRMYDLDRTGGPMFEMYMRNALLLVMDNEFTGGTLMDIPLIFEDKGYLQFLIRKCRNPYVVNFWRKQAIKAGGEISMENITPYVTSKLNLFTSNALLRPIIGQSRTTIDFRQCMDDRRIILVNLSKGLLGELDARLLGMLIIGKLFSASMQRALVPEKERLPFYLYIDEVHNFATETIVNMMAEARKFGLYMTLANQNLEQVKTKDEKTNMMEAILGNVGSILMFRLGAPDADKMELYTKPELKSRVLQDLPNYHVIARLLSKGLPTRPFIFQTELQAHSQYDESSREKINKTLNKNYLRYTCSVAEIEKLLLERRTAYMNSDRTLQCKENASKEELWVASMLGHKPPGTT